MLMIVSGLSCWKRMLVQGFQGWQGIVLPGPGFATDLLYGLGHGPLFLYCLVASLFHLG